MAAARMATAGVVAITLAITAGVIALASEFLQYSRCGCVDWGHVALAFGMPALMYGILRGAAARQ